MAPSSPEAPSTREMVWAKRHLKFRGQYSVPTWFSEPFPGLCPSHIQRQQYAKAFLRWYFGDTQFNRFEIELAQTADSDVVDDLIEWNMEPSSPAAFEFSVDQAFWELHFCWLREGKRPPWPWVDVETLPTDDDLADRFSWFKSEWKGKRSLRPAETRHEAAFPPPITSELTDACWQIPLTRKSTSVETSSLFPDETKFLLPNKEEGHRCPPRLLGIEIEGKTFPMAPPRPRSEDALWKIRYPTHAPPCGTPFLLEIPEHPDFWTYVWGPAGWDWAEIIDNYIDDRVNFAWGYKNREQHPDTETTHDLWRSRPHLPDEDMFLMIGFREFSWNDPHALSPVRQNLITKLWKAINEWKQLCLSGKWTTLISFLQHMHEEGGTIQETDTTFTFASSVLRIGNTASRARAESEIDDIFRSIMEIDVEVEEFGNHCHDWVFFPSKQDLTVEERIYLVANLWRRMLLPKQYELLVEIQAWVTGAREMVRSGAYPSLR